MSNLHGRFQDLIGIEDKHFCVSIATREEDQHLEFESTVDFLITETALH
jgi:hypothetical protein